MSVRCEHCGAVASYGRELSHRSDCNRPMKVTIPVRRGHGAGHVQMEEFEAPPSATVTITRAQYEALMGAVKVLDRCINDDGELTKRNGIAAESIEALAALRAAGIDLEEGK